MKSFLFLILSLLFYANTMAQFHVNGDAGQLEEHCYQLTPPEFDQAGTIWNLSKINLTQPFDTTFQLFLGCNDFDGGDGIVFAFQPNGVSVGNYNGHLGYAFLSPSLAIEIDTYQNPEHNDPGFDHLAIVRDGISDHQAGENLAGPVQVNPIDPDVEDCRFHDFRVSWEPDGEDLTVYWNCELRLSYSGNIINSVFGGDPEVFWGFTSGTSTVKNAQEVCIGKANELNILQDVTLCPGGEIDLFSPVQGITYTWSPPAGLNETDIPNPVASPDTTTTYTVIITDDCGELLTDDITIFVEGTPIDIDFGSEDTVLCEGTTLVLDAFHAGSTYNWSTGSTDSALSVAESGFYALTLTNGECIASERIFVNFIGPPAIELGLDTVICEDNTLVLDAFYEGSDYLWHDGSRLPEYEVIHSGIYEITVTNQCGTTGDAIAITFEKCGAVYLPNVFSPNGDGVNDYFFVQASPQVERVISLKIFDRWGGLIFEATNFTPNDRGYGWDGSFNNKKIDVGVYLYLVEVELVNGQHSINAGDVTLLK